MPTVAETQTSPVAAMTLPTAAETGDRDTLMVLEQSDPGDRYAYVWVREGEEQRPGVLLTAGQLRQLAADLNRRADILAIHIDGDRALELLRQVVAAKGASTRYELRPKPLGATCQYAHNGCPDCLIGHALALAGVTVDELVDMDADPVRTGIAFVTLPPRLNLTESARRVFSAAQNKQDDGVSWGGALAAAELAAGPVAS